MSSYCLKSKKNIENIDPKVSKTNNGRTMILSYCLKYGGNAKSINPLVSETINGGTIILSKSAVYNSKKSRFIKKQEAKGLLSNLSIRTLLSKIPILKDILF